MAKSEYSLTLENQQSNDYVLNPGHTAWITVGEKSIYISPKKIEVYNLHEEMEDPIVSINL